MLVHDPPLTRSPLETDGHPGPGIGHGAIRSPPCHVQKAEREREVTRDSYVQLIERHTYRSLPRVEPALQLARVGRIPAAVGERRREVEVHNIVGIEPHRALRVLVCDQTSPLFQQLPDRLVGHAHLLVIVATDCFIAASSLRIRQRTRSLGSRRPPDPLPERQRGLDAGHQVFLTSYTRLTRPSLIRFVSINSSAWRP